MICTFFLHFYCYGMRSAMLQINEYDDDDDDDARRLFPAEEINNNLRVPDKSGDAR